jgi:hypothetical protein
MLDVRDDHDGGSETVPRTAWLAYCYTPIVSPFLINLASRDRIERSILWQRLRTVRGTEMCADRK